MIDVRRLRSESEVVRERLAVRGDADVDGLLDRVLALDTRRREILGEVEVLKQRRNEASREIGDRKRSGESATDLMAEMKAVAERVRELDGELGSVEDDLGTCLAQIPNLPDERVPPGGVGDFVVIRSVGEPRPQTPADEPHWEIGERLAVLDLERGSKITGSGFPVLFGAGARLNRALIHFMLDLHTEQHGYIEVAPPFLANRESLVSTGQLPKFEEDQYRTEVDDLFLVPTAEVPVTNLHRGEVLDASELPIAYVAYTPCFRREAGAAGRDTRGLLRVHQFDKVELVRFTRPEDSAEQLELLTGHAESVLERLELPFRRILLPAGDLGFANAITYDLEVWSPGVDRWLEVSSCSSYTDFQARRGSIRFREEGSGKPGFVHTLNGSGVALARTLVAILENRRESDGSVSVPDVLRPYTGFDRLSPP